jgi:hypothetical protein
MHKEEYTYFPNKNNRQNKLKGSILGRVIILDKQEHRRHYDLRSR